MRASFFDPDVWMLSYDGRMPETVLGAHQDG